MSSLYKSILAVVIGTLSMGAKPAWTASTTHTASTQASTEQAAAKRKTLMAEATSAIAETQNALKALDNGKSKEALSALERATGKLEIILARDPKLTLAPAGMNVVTQDVQGGLEAVKQARKKAEDLIHEGRLQQARLILNNLASETVINVINIPLATYPTAIKQAVALIDQNKTEDAKRVLQDALNTEVITQTIIPLPLVSAQDALSTAEKLAEKKQRTADDNSHLAASLGEARSQLMMAQELGYGVKSDFDHFYEDIAQITRKTSDNKSGKGFFEKIKSSLSELLKSS